LNPAQIVFLHSLLLFVPPAISEAQCKIVLRSLEEVESQKFDFDPFQIVSDDQRKLYWDNVLWGKVGDRQDEFNALLKEIGDPLFRARHRVSIGDFKSLQGVAHQLHQKFGETLPTRENCRTKFIVSLARICDEVGRSRPEYATIAFIESSDLLAAYPEELELVPVPPGLTKSELEQCFTEMLLPIWFSRERATTALQQIEARWEAESEEASDGEWIYGTSLAIAAGDDHAKKYLRELRSRSSKLTESWRPLLLAYEEVMNEKPDRNIAQLEKNVRSLKGAPRAVAQYLLGIAAGAQNQQFDKGMLLLLYIPAVYGSQFRGLSAAALSEAASLARNAGHQFEAESLKAELTRRYPDSQHAQLQQSK